MQDLNLIQHSINLAEMQTLFMQAVANILPPQFVSNISFAISIDGIPVSPTTGTNIVEGDAEGYFSTDPTRITFARG